ncbi:MAG: hypothetical protein OSJ37_08515 [Muribaculaceae bacterium]|jgi:hypothetical protein|nr:hypothetical protein [Muribaculaceae bacterium]
MILLMSLGTFLGYATCAIFVIFFILLVIAGAKDPTAMYGVPKEKIINALDSLVELQKKVEKIEKHIDTEKGDKETTEESQSPE